MTRYSCTQLRAFEAASHALLAGLSLAAAFELRFEFSIPHSVRPLLLDGLMVAIPAKMAVFFFGRFRRRLRIYAEIPDLFRLLARNILSSSLFAVAAWSWMGWEYPRSVYLIDFLVSFVGMAIAW